MKLALSPLFKIGLCTLGYLYITSNVTQAQVTADDTLNTNVTQNGKVAEITGGETRESNLFHSFQEFSVGSGNEAFFNNATNISNIFSRVTGGKVSNIDGLIRANGNASLFLINPQGIIFGEGASLDIGGSFYGSSASGILFEDGEFSATDLDNPPLLTINAPVGLSFRDNPGKITLSGTNLTVGKSQNIGLIGGAIALDDSSLESGGISLGGLATSGTVGIDSNGSFNFSDAVTKANVSLDNSNLSVDNPEGSAIAIDGNDIAINSSKFNEGNPQGGAIAIKGNDITITSSELNVSDPQKGAIAIDGNDITMNGGSLFAGTENKINLTGNNISFTGALVNSELFGQGDASAGDINLTADNSINLKNSEILNQINLGNKGNTGNINLNANSISLDNSQITNQINEGAEGNINQVGNIKLTANSLNLNNGSGLFNSTKGIGNAGNINLDVSGNVNFISSSMQSEVEVNAEGNAGNIDVTADSITLQNNSIWQATTTGEGNAGNIIISVAKNFNLGDINDDSNLDGNNLILSQVLPEETGSSGSANRSSGDINITVGGSLQADTSLIIADSKDKGSSGDIIVNVGNKIILEGKPSLETGRFPSQIVTGLDEKLDDNEQVISAGEGRAGNIKLSANELIMTDLAFIISNTETTAKGNAGNITVDVQELKITDNAFISAFTENEFNGGTIIVNAQSLELSRGGKLFTSTDGAGDAGNINLNIADSITIDNGEKPSVQIPGLFEDDLSNELQGQGGIFANATETATGNGGNITIGVGEIVEKEEGEGFDFQVNQPTPNITLSNNAQITAGTTAEFEEDSGNGGNINIDADLIVAEPNEIDGDGSDIVANAQAGNGGNINITAEGLFGIRERDARPGNRTNDIDASSQDGGIDGTVSIFTPVDRIKNVNELPSNVIEPQETTTQACDAQRGVAAASVLTVKGRGGVPPEPIAPLNSENILINGQAVATSPNTQPQAIPTAQGDIIPARGVVKTKDGRIILSAYPTDNQGDRLTQGSSNCS